MKQKIKDLLVRLRKAINPIRWLGYVRPDETVKSVVGYPDYEVLYHQTLNQLREAVDKQVEWKPSIPEFIQSTINPVVWESDRPPNADERNVIVIGIDEDGDIDYSLLDGDEDTLDEIDMENCVEVLYVQVPPWYNDRAREIANGYTEDDDDSDDE